MKQHQSLGELFKLSWEIYSKNLGLLLIIVLIGMLVSAVILVPGILIFVFLMMMASAGEALSWTSGWVIGGIVIGAIDFGLVIAWSLIYTIAMVEAVYRRADHKEIDYKEAFRFGFGKFWPVFWASILASLIIFLGIILFVLPGIAAAIYLYFVMYAVLFEGKRGTEALSRSFEMVKGNWWWVFLVVLIVGLLSGIAGSIPFAGGIVQLILMPFWTTIAVVLYRDLKKLKS